MTEDATQSYNRRIEALRDHEYPMLKGSIYLDHAGTTLYAKSLVDRFAADMTSNLFGNPHSASASSQTSASRIDDIRLRVLQFFNADPSEFDLIFVANATAGIKLVAEALGDMPGGFHYLYHQASHTSLVGVRQEAVNSKCLDDHAVSSWLGGNHPIAEVGSQSTTLFAYPAQSNMDGRRYPLDWAVKLREHDRHGQVLTLLDAAAYVSTSPLDLGNSDSAPDFTVLSFYKIFGFPDLGGLIVRRQAMPVFQHRRYFGGGTVDMVVCSREQWHISKTQSLHESVEDGTLPIHSIIALDTALGVHRELFGSMRDIASHTSSLARRLYHRLSTLKHYNGESVCTIYSLSSLDSGTTLGGNGPVISFNLRNHLGAWISLTEFEKLAVLRQFHIRTGGVCNPGGIASALNLQPWEMRRNFSAGFRCGSEADIIGGKPTGIIRVSLGAMSTIADVDHFAEFIDEFYRTPSPTESVSLATPDLGEAQSNLYVQSIMVYPIKSCGGYQVPKGAAWEVRAEGFAWDREWCLIHRGTGQALSQKRHPRMALIRPSIDFASGLLKVSYAGIPPRRVEGEIAIPLSADPTVFGSLTTSRHMSSRVCGEEISAQIYTASKINDFFSDILDVPCALARFPPGGLGKSMRHAKAHLQRHQRPSGIGSGPAGGTPGAIGGVVTPPDSDSDSDRQRILLSNESPILAINLASLQKLNDEIALRGGGGGKPVGAEVFRANVVVGSSTPTPDSFAYSEDHWSRLRIGHQDFKMLGSCRRCHMVCIDQETAGKSEEPFITLARTRRFEGKVFFGTHMCHMPSKWPDSGSKRAQFPTISVGDKVSVDPI
ncbi:hypothetical protein SLS62_005582 [Diatrype stigma]|uniref:Molybdenum cofactor sulfurase n=1 Tax=Diatrype stigma TaxID=117547 RepID=A0AAN9V082_9PEZI